MSKAPSATASSPELPSEGMMSPTMENTRTVLA